MPKLIKGHTTTSKKKNKAKLFKAGVPKKVATAISNRIAKKAKKTVRKKK